MSLGEFFFKLQRKLGLKDSRQGFGVLSDVNIVDRIVNDDLIVDKDFDLKSVQSASVDLHLSNDLRRIDGRKIDLTDSPYLLSPNEFILGSTREWVNIPVDLVAQVDGKSSIARLGVEVHRTAGWIDTGFKGNITLEIHNCGDRPFKLAEDMMICQIIFLTLTTPCKRSYGSEELGSHYQNSNGTVLSRHKD